MKSRLKTWLTAALFAVVLSIAYLLDGPSEIDAYRASAAATTDAIKEQSAEIIFAAAAQKVCGPNSAWTLTARVGEIQCLLHTGRKSIVAKVEIK